MKTRLQSVEVVRVRKREGVFHLLFPVLTHYRWWCPSLTPKDSLVHLVGLGRGSHLPQSLLFN